MPNAMQLLSGKVKIHQGRAGCKVHELYHDLPGNQNPLFEGSFLSLFHNFKYIV